MTLRLLVFAITLHLIPRRLDDVSNVDVRRFRADIERAIMKCALLIRR